MTDRRTFLRQTGVLMIGVATLTPSAFAGGRRSPVRFPPPTTASRVVNASRASKGHMHHHVARSTAYAQARMKSGVDRRLFNATAKGATPNGRMPSERTLTSLRQSYERSHARKPGVSAAEAKRQADRSMKALRRQVNHLKKHKARVTRVSNIKDPKVVDRLFEQARSNPANRRRLADLKRQSGKHPTRTVPIAFDAGRNVGTVHQGRPGAKGTTTPASKGVFNVRLSPSGKLIAHTMKLEPSR